LLSKASIKIHETLYQNNWWEIIKLENGRDKVGENYLKG
jgi:hypothetical protein